MTELSTPRDQRRQYSHIGWVMTMMLVFSILLPNISAIIAKVLWPNYTGNMWAVFAVNYGLFYLLGYPYACLMMRLRTVGVPPKANMKPLQFCAALPVCITLMYAGSLLGNMLNAVIGVLRGEMPTNDLQGMLENTDTGVVILFVVILGPLMEELLFRKALVDVLYPLGETACVLLGGLIFGLIHGNFYQFFYAFLIGGLFTLIYCRTGKVRYTVVLHMLVNLQGSVLAPWILSLLDTTALEEGNYAQLLADNPFGLLLYMGYCLLMLALAAAGVALLILGFKKMRPKKSAVPLFHPLRTALINPGIIVFLIAGLAMILYRF